jgi:hypothetical protein
LIAQLNFESLGFCVGVLEGMEPHVWFVSTHP